MTEFAHTNHCGITYEPTEHGERVTITADDGCHVIVGDRAVPMVELRVIDFEMPKVGRTYVIEGHAIEVNDWRFDEAGILWVESTATRTWWRWPM